MPTVTCRECKKPINVAKSDMPVGNHKSISTGVEPCPGSVDNGFCTDLEIEQDDSTSSDD